MACILLVLVLSDDGLLLCLFLCLFRGGVDSGVDINNCEDVDGDGDDKATAAADDTPAVVVDDPDPDAVFALFL